MIVIPTGSFEMGEPGQQHTVTFQKPFAIGRCEITFADYQQFTSTTQRKLPDDLGWGKDDRPVINVSWDDAVAYAQWLSKVTGRNYRLPSEAEWEYAARAKTTGVYYWGDGDAGNYAWFSGNSNNRTQPVGEKKPNDFGLYDVSGNVIEWVQDCYSKDYGNTPEDGSAWDEKGCTQRVLRGGSWVSGASELRSALRFGGHADTRDGLIGFRLAQDLP